MHKIITAHVAPATSSDQGWLELERLALVEVSSEEDRYPIEAALIPGRGAGWRAAQAGAQTIRILFDTPQRLSRIWLIFSETETARTQEFVLRWSPEGAAISYELLRQQWTFSPPGTTRELEDYRFDLRGVKILDLTIVPDISGGAARAALEQMRLA